MKHLILTIVCALVSSGCFANQPIAIKGVLDLSDWNFETQGNVSLQGDWDFYWQQHLTSYELSLKSGIGPKRIHVPGNWNSDADGGFPADGFATYRLKLLVPDKKPLSLKLLTVGTAYRLYIDGTERIEVGRAGQTAETTTPAYRSEIVTFAPGSSQVEIVIQVSNFHHRNAGLWEIIRLGRPDAIANLREKEQALDFILFGAILMMGLYNLTTWATRRENISGLYLGGFCLLIAFRILLVDERYITELMPSLGWPFLTRIEYFCWMVSVPIFMSFIRSIYTDEVSAIVSKGLWVVALCFGGLALVLPIQAATELVPPYQIVTIIGMLLGAYSILLAIWRKKDGSVLMGIGCFFIFASAFADISTVYFAIGSENQLQFGVFIFVLLQSIQVSLRHSRAFQLIELQDSKLLKTSLELQIQDRIRRAAEGATSMANKEANHNERLSSFAVIASAMAKDIASRGNDPTSTRAVALLNDISLLVHRESLPRTSVDPARFFEDFFASTEFEDLYQHYQFVDLQFNFEPGESKFNVSVPHLQTLVLYFMRYIFEIQSRQQTLRIIGKRDYVLAGSLFHHQVSDGNYYILAIEDAGKSIRPEDLIDIFDPDKKLTGFSSLAPALRNLAVVWMILEDHGGALDLHSLKESTRLELYFPCQGEPIG